MDKNIINQNIININNNVNQNTININQTNSNQSYDKDGFFIYNPYSINSPIPTTQDSLQFMKVKELDVNDENVQRCFRYLQEYDSQNCLLLDYLLKEMYLMARKISTTKFNIVESEPKDFTGEFWMVPILFTEYMESLRPYLVDYNKDRNSKYNLKTKIKWGNVGSITGQFPEITRSFYNLKCQLNPEKYNNTLCQEFDIKDLMHFCYYISNTLVCISHDIVYAINKEINKLSNCNYKNKKNKISNNIHHIIVKSFYSIMHALPNLQSSMFLNDLLCIDMKKN